MPEESYAAWLRGFYARHQNKILIAGTIVALIIVAKLVL